MQRIMAAIRAIRNRRNEMNVPPSRKAKVFVATKFPQTFEDGKAFIIKAQSEGKLRNQGFVSKAPAAVVEGVKKQAEKERETIALIEAAIAALQ